MCIELTGRHVDETKEWKTTIYRRTWKTLKKTLPINTATLNSISKVMLIISLYIICFYFKHHVSEARTPLDGFKLSRKQILVIHHFKGGTFSSIYHSPTFKVHKEVLLTGSARENGSPFFLWEAFTYFPYFSSICLQMLSLNRTPHP